MKRAFIIVLILSLMSVSGCKGWPIKDEMAVIELTVPYTEVRPFRGNRALVVKNGKEGVINTDGIEIFPAEYGKDTNLVGEDWVALQLEEGCSVADSQGHILFTSECDYIYNFVGGLFDAVKDGKYVFVNMEGEIVGSHDYVVFHRNDKGYIIAEKNKKYGVVDGDGNVTTPLEYDQLLYDTDTGLLRAEKDGKYGFLDFSGRVIVPLEYDEAEFFIYGCAQVKKDGKWGLFDTEGNMVLPLEYDTLRTYKFYKTNIENMVLTMHKDGKSGMCNPKGQILLEPVYDHLVLINTNLVGAGKDGQQSLINFTTGSTVVLPQYDYVTRTVLSEGPIAVQHGGKWGYIDTAGVVLIPVELEYDNAAEFFDGLARVKKGDKYGFIDMNGKLVIPIVYSEAEDFSNGVSLVKKEDKYYYINTQGKKATSFEFDKIYPYSRDYYDAANYDDVRDKTHGSQAIGKIGSTWYLIKKE